MRNKRWRDATTGPDVLDVETMMRSIQSAHSGNVTLIISPRGTGASGGVNTTLGMEFNVLPGSALPAVVGVNSDWPCQEHKDFWAHIFSMLYALDAEIGKVYEQTELWTK